MSLNNLQNKLKIQTKLCITRLRLIEQKIMAIHKSQEKELAILLGKDMKQNLMIKAENMIRENMKIELLGILNLYCEVLLSRFHLLKKGYCHEQIEQAVCTLIYATPRCDVKELHNMNGIFRLYFGKEFIQDSVENKHGKVDPKVAEKLSNKSVNNDLIESYLEEIARFYNIKQDCNLNASKMIDDTALYNKELEDLLKNNNSSKFVVSSLSSPDDSESQLKLSLIYSQNNYNRGNSDFINFSEISKEMSQNMSNVSNIDQLRERFERLKQI
ncbi:uncharacterized protein T551_01015 [Pneumocystis jirovecii RU7]|uniref:Uncharacterized protein n=1 Tax=Pneumocystis jirovecii (strain RU7) TaxID=1408657 RepID=A0A0W4ZTS2_PNEJ7|nr:uncharacterized protein T551_01015 [Pneumocystis jirovecii RU7]KTW31754.1 hypothetical protein T551_01015 [Pneumocystis jirovecii RU7]